MSIVERTASAGSHACTMIFYPGRSQQLLIATTKLHSVLIRDWNSIENTSTVISEYICVDKIDKIEFSPDGITIFRTMKRITIYEIPIFTYRVFDYVCSILKKCSSIIFYSK